MTQVVDGEYEWSMKIDGDETFRGFSYGEVRENDSLGIIIGAAGSYRASDLRVDNVELVLSMLCNFGPAKQADFVRTKGKPTPESVTWESCGGSGVMLVTTDHVSSAYVVLNGTMLLSPDDFHNSSGSLEVPIVLAEGANTVEPKMIDSGG